jgi:hypothetical protein
VIFVSLDAQMQGYECSLSNKSKGTTQKTQEEDEYSLLQFF